MVAEGAQGSRGEPGCSPILGMKTEAVEDKRERREEGINHPQEEKRRSERRAELLSVL